MTPEQLERAKREFYLRYHHFKETDDLLFPFLNAKQDNQWLRRSRQASLMSAKVVARRAGIKRNNYYRLEANETNATLATLQKAAEALDCELVYAIRPRAGGNFMQRIWNVIYAAVKDAPNIDTAGNPSLRLAALVNMQLYDPGFRKAQGWIRNTESEAQFFMPARFKTPYT